MTFGEVENRARSEWETLQNTIHIIIGTATCGRAAGALDIADIINRELVRRNIEVPVIQVGCMGLCYAEPLVIVCKPEFLSVKEGLLIKQKKLKRRENVSDKGNRNAQYTVSYNARGYANPLQC